MPAGRPSEYTQDKADAIIERLSEGESLRSICKDDAMPSQPTVFRWIARNEEFRVQYALAREVQADVLFDEILDIADDGSNDWLERQNSDGESTGWRENGEAIRRSALRVDARKWMVGKLQPKKYGEKVTNVHEGGEKPIEVNSVTDVDRAKAMALLATKAKRNQTVIIAD